MRRRELRVELDRDRHYPRFSGTYFRNRWAWRTTLVNEGDKAPFGIYAGRAAFSLTALVKAHFPRLFGRRVQP